MTSFGFKNSNFHQKVTMLAPLIMCLIILLSHSYLIPPQGHEARRASLRVFRQMWRNIFSWMLVYHNNTSSKQQNGLIFL